MADDNSAVPPVSRDNEPPIARPSQPPFKVFKPGQGSYVRWCTAVGAGVVILAGGHFIYEQLPRFNVQDSVWRLIVPLAFVVAMMYWAFRLVGQNQKIVDFMIATEGEMKKVNWSTRREVIGATRIVIFTLLVLGALLFLVDIFFIAIFELMGILKTGMLAGLFGRGGGE